MIYDTFGRKPLAVGLAADEILGYAQSHAINMKVIFLNDGPGLLLGSMWDDYARLEQSWSDKILVMTLRMVAERLTREWLEADF